jgi:hypothetical protein
MNNRVVLRRRGWPHPLRLHELGGRARSRRHLLKPDGTRSLLHLVGHPLLRRRLLRLQLLRWLLQLLRRLLHRGLRIVHVLLALRDELNPGRLVLDHRMRQRPLDLAGGKKRGPRLCQGLRFDLDPRHREPVGSGAFNDEDARCPLVLGKGRRRVLIVLHMLLWLLRLKLLLELLWLHWSDHSGLDRWSGHGCGICGTRRIRGPLRMPTLLKHDEVLLLWLLLLLLIVLLGLHLTRLLHLLLVHVLLLLKW